MANSNRKGKKGERMACKLLRKLGYDARRSQQYSGVKQDNSSADILTSLDEYIRPEVKFGYDVELWHKAVQDWVEQARQETPDDKKWVILYKKTGARSWTIIFEIDGVICQSADVENAIPLIINGE